MPTVSTTPTPAPGPKEKLLMSTTTSMQDTGLLDYLKPYFDSKYNMDLQWTSKGSGQALADGRLGNVDVLIVHSPADEKKFVDEGYGWNRTQFAHNFYVIVGPVSDPAGIKNMTNASQAFAKIREQKAKFISRGDNSGTNAKELTLWNMTGSTPSNKTESSWYVSTGQGMGATLQMAEQMQAYTLSDLSYLHSQPEEPHAGRSGRERSGQPDQQVRRHRNQPYDVPVEQLCRCHEVHRVHDQP